MADTISAATAWTPGDVRLNFVSPVDLSDVAAPDIGFSHISGSAFSADASPGLIVNFVTLTPDASGWSYSGASATADQTPATVAAGYASDVPDPGSPVIVGALGTT